MEISRSTALEIFGLKEGFSETDLKKQYRRLVKIVHPDTGGDEQLFKFIDSCKQLLANGDNTAKTTNGTNSKSNTSNNSKSNNESNNYKSNSYKNSSQPKKEDARISLELLDEEYPYVNEYEKKYNITQIYTTLLIYMQPRFRKKLKKCISENVAVPYSTFNKDGGYVKFDHTVKIPKELQKFNRFKISVKFLDKTFNFTLSAGQFKVLDYRRYKYVRCLKSICELHFEK